MCVSYIGDKNGFKGAVRNQWGITSTMLLSAETAATSEDTTTRTAHLSLRLSSTPSTVRSMKMETITHINRSSITRSSSTKKPSPTIKVYTSCACGVTMIISFPHQFSSYKLFSFVIGGALKGKESKVVTDGHQRAYEIEKSWMYKRENEPVTAQWNSVADIGRSPRSFRNSSSSSSDSSSNRGGFSSSESDYSSRSESKSRYSSSCYSMKKLKPIWTSISGERLARPHMMDVHGEDDNLGVHQVIRPHFHKQGGGGRVVKAKSKALKIYEEFKRVSGNNNKPVSPGAKLASFLNALFSAKKAKHSSEYDANFPGRVPESGYSSTCSSASFSRSCLSKTPSSRGKFTVDGSKRTVRFCPVSVVVDEDRRPCGQKSLQLGENHQGANSTMVKIYPKTQENQELFYGREDREDIDENDDDDDGGASCASSDLFELENLSGIGIGGGYRYSEELPVYETTNLDTNRAIANGLIV